MPPKSNLVTGAYQPFGFGGGVEGSTLLAEKIRKIVFERLCNALLPKNTLCEVRFQHSY